MKDTELQKLLERAKKTGIPVAHIAREAKVSRAAVYRVSNGEGEPLYSTRTRLADALARMLEARNA